MLNLGSLYGRGEGVKMDMKKATQLTKMASDRGDAGAQCNYGNAMRMTGKNEEALRYFRLSADQGFTGAEYCLGVVYMKGDCGVEVDNDEAARWFARAASKGYSHAIEQLSELQDGRT
jgi:TPR repeat protein